MVDLFNVNLTEKEDQLVRQIAKRAKKEHLTPDETDLEMDLVCVHTHVQRLDLERLLNARKSDFAHDIGGIRENLDRHNGRLMNFFLPRFSSKKKGPKK